MAVFTEVPVSSLSFNPFTKFDNEWMLVSAGTKSSFNMMTASWGGVGTIWNKYAATVYIRPQRYTHDFIEKNEYFSLSFYEDSFRPALAICGRESGRDGDKSVKAGLTPVFSESAPYFSEARLVLICRKIYKGAIDPNGFIDPEINECYSNKDYHDMYIGEVVKVLEKKFVRDI